MREGPEIAGAIILLITGKGKPRNRIIQVNLEHQESLVVLEADVVTRMEFLDEFTFQQQRFRLTPNYMHIQVMNGFDQRLELGIPPHAPGGLKVLTDPSA